MDKEEGLEETVGLTLEVDLVYPIELHDAHNDFPLAPESYTVSNEELALSSYAKKKLKGRRRIA